MLSRILGSVGRTLITSGLVVLLFVGYQLWGTGIQEAQAQNSLGDEFDELLVSDTNNDGAEQLEADLDSATAVSNQSPTTAPTISTPASTPPTTAVASGGEQPLAFDDAASPTTTVAFDPTLGPDVPIEGAAPVDTIPVFDQELAEKLYRDGGEAIARIIIPDIEVRKVVVEGVQVEDLRNGPGHYRATVLPGQEGNAGIAGHRTTYGAPFNRIDELQPGDEINVQTVQGLHRYRVMSNEEAFGEAIANGDVDFEIPEEDLGKGYLIVPPSATWVLGDFGDNRLTLTACHPKFSAAKRIVVAAVLISDLVDSPPPPEGYSTADDLALAAENVDDSEASGSAEVELADDASAASSAANAAATSRASFVDEVSLDEGLNGEKDALRPALLWGLLATVLYLGFKELGARWRLWPAVALGIAPVAIALALCFEKVDRYLPAG